MLRRDELREDARDRRCVGIGGDNGVVCHQRTPRTPAGYTLNGTTGTPNRSRWNGDAISQYAAPTTIVRRRKRKKKTPHAPKKARVPMGRARASRSIKPPLRKARRRARRRRRHKAGGTPTSTNCDQFATSAGPIVDDSVWLPPAPVPGTPATTRVDSRAHAPFTGSRRDRGNCGFLRRAPAARPAKSRARRLRRDEAPRGRGASR